MPLVLFTITWHVAQEKGGQDSSGMPLSTIHLTLPTDRFSLMPSHPGGAGVMVHQVLKKGFWNDF